MQGRKQVIEILHERHTLIPLLRHLHSGYISSFSGIGKVIDCIHFDIGTAPF